MCNYEKQAKDFANKYDVKLAILGSEYKVHFHDNVQRHVFKCRLSRNGRRYTFEFGQSIAAWSKPPTMYDVLTCLQKYDVGTFENFCNDFGYDTDSRSAERTYKAVVREFNAVVRLFGDILDELIEIQ